MPLLNKEPDCFPLDLFERLADSYEADDETTSREASAFDDDSENGIPRWWVARTLSRREKEMMRRLTAGNVAFYTPIVKKRSRSPAGRVRESFVPLFPGYVFLHGRDADRRTALATNCTASILVVDDQRRLYRELLQIRQLLDSDRPVTPEEKLQRGQPVRVVSGPLRGQEGVVIERLGKRRLLVTVELLQRGASVDLDECDVKPI